VANKCYRGQWRSCLFNWCLLGEGEDSDGQVGFQGEGGEEDDDLDELEDDDDELEDGDNDDEDEDNEF